MRMGLMERLRDTDDILTAFWSLQTLLVDEYGKPMEVHLSQWILDHPGEFQGAIRRAFAAGFDIVHTGTQASSLMRAKPFGVEDRVYEFNYKSVKLAKEVAPEDGYICGDISSSNPDFLEPLGNMTYDEVYQAYKEQVLGLLEGRVDLVTVSGNHIDENEIGIRAVKDLSDIPVLSDNVFYMTKKKGFRTMMGVDPKTGAARLQEAGADAVGFACGLMTKSRDTSAWYPAATALLKEMRQGTDRYLYLAPDAGVAELIDGKTVWPASPEEMAREVPNWIEVGVRIIGGDCGTSLEHGRMISAVVRERKAKRE